MPSVNGYPHQSSSSGIFLKFMPYRLIVLSVTGYVASPRMVSGTKSDLLYEILKALRNADISLSQTQTMVLEQPFEKR